MGRPSRAAIVGLISAALLMPAGYVATTTAAATAAVPSISASTPAAASVVAPEARAAKKKKKKKAKKKTKVRCVIVKKRVGKKIKKVKKCKKVTVKKKAAKATALKTIAAPTPTAIGGGIPTASNTGVPAGMGLTVHNGDLTITTPGTVIDGRDIRGYVAIKAPNVTIKRSIIRGGAAATVNRALLAMTQSGAGNFLIEDVTIAPTNPSPYINGINVNQAGTIRRADISGTVDGIMIYGSGVRVEASYLHHFTHYVNDPNWNGGPSHDDAIQVQAGNGVAIVGNSLSGAYNAAVMVTQDAGTTSNLSINGNFLDYGGCSVNFGSNGAYKNGMQVNGNRFGRAQRNANCAIIHNSARSDLVPAGNVWDNNSAPVSVTRGS